MKKLFVLFFMLPFILYAQQYTEVVKWSPLDLYFNQLNLSWEQNRGKNSLELDLGIPLNRSMNSSGYAFTKFGTESVRLGYRFYTAKKDKRYGFYLEPYFRTTTFRLDGVPEGQTVKFHSFLNTDALGVQIGYQFVVSKNIVIDFYFAGLEGGRAHGWLNADCGNDIDAFKMSDFVQSKVKKVFPNYIVNHFQGGVWNGKVGYEMSSFAYPMFRGGFSVGLWF